MVSDDSPVVHGTLVTPNDSNDLGYPVRAIYVGGAGNAQVTLAGDSNPVTFTNLAVGWHPMRVRRVWATLTTATNILALS